MCDNYGMKDKPSTSYNQQSNGSIERVNQVLGNALRTFELKEKGLNTNDPWGHFLSAAAWAIRSTVHSYYVRCHAWTACLWTRHATTDPNQDGLGSNTAT